LIDERSGSATPTGNALLAALSTAIGDSHRPDPVLEHTGGPAGNARLTAWIGLVILALSLADAITLVSVGHFITAHILIGALLVPLALMKTATTGWRIVRYYQGAPAYRQAGPPPLLLRILGPLVILTSLAVLGSGLALIALGQSAFATIVTVFGFGINAVTIHQVAFAAWLVITGLHVLGRTVPAIKVLTASTRRHRPVPGAGQRAATIVAAIVVSVATALIVVDLSGAWTQHRFGDFHHRHGGPARSTHRTS
jgi:hypothetical protein